MTKGILSLLFLSLASLACLSTLPVEPAPAVVKGVSTPAVIYTSTPELIRKVCLTADAVNLRTGAGTGFESVAVLDTAIWRLLEISRQRETIPSR